ncbi:Histone H2A.Z-specific chaperone CHZ1 [Lachancea thermotolerans]|uniref:Histone H2A.Z-specific chaperone CHZ1 n=1 Tax=Lachancea thermotolerans (strain ATCC 56472 / CBS 6340 / NRRL Y-8284) TaxID=559295 RepID=C5DLM1_LACTC|nr:KLTH0G01782p [Lachancea thermotolerans CBS 6340]CAR24682.1 KLTH0G01782p [Lachancea thermotolerans CBS 6340]
MAETKKHELKDQPDKKRVKRRRNYDDYDKEVAAEDSKAKKENKGTGDNGSESESEDDEKLDMMLNKEDEEEDDLAEIDSSNIIQGGRRTRGKVIDYKKTAEALDKESGKASEEPKEELAQKDVAKKSETAEEDEDAEDADFKEPEK